MKKFYLLTLNLLTIIFFANAQFNIQSQKCFGDTGDEGANKIITTRDGGYIFAGWVTSDGDDVSGYKGGAEDAWVVKVSSNNTIEWQHTIGGTGDDVAYDIKQTSDGGFIVSGQTNSNDGDFTEDNHGSIDAFAVKLDSTGTIVWANSYGGSNDDGGQRIFELTGGKYIMIGYTFSDNELIDPNHVGRALVVELDSRGVVVWNKTYGGSQDEEFTGMATDAAGQYIFTGNTTSPDGNVTGNHGGADVWAVKTDTTGSLLAQKCFGGTENEFGNDMFALPSGDMVITGLTYSNNGDVSGNQGEGDVWIVRIDTAFNLVWQKCMGGSQYDELTDATLLNGNIIATGITESNDGDFAGLNHGNTDDVLLVNLDISGNTLFKKCYGGAQYEDGFGICVKNTSVYVCGIASSNDGDVSGNHGGVEDAWVLHLSNPNAVNDLKSFSAISIYPNPSSGNFRISFTTSQSTNGKIELINMLGETILSNEVRLNEGNNLVNLNTIDKGIFFLRLSTANGEWIGKVVLN